MKQAKKMKKKTKTSAKPKASAKPQKSAAAPRRKTSEKVRTAASKLKKTTKKLVDDVFLKVVGMKVLARAQEITKAIQKEKRSLKKARR